jgi:hypothetical protein
MKTIKILKIINLIFFQLKYFLKHIKNKSYRTPYTAKKNCLT